MKKQLQTDSKVNHSHLVIQPRRVRFDFSDIESPFYYDDNPLISALWVALSASFPLGEAEFIKATKYFEEQITTPKLKDDVEKFAQQEAHHSLQHRLLNQQFESLGYLVSDLEGAIRQELKKREQKWSIERRLANTVAAEHVTSTMANWALMHPDQMALFPNSLREMLLWHSIEEVEHKSVTYDVYQECVGKPNLLKWQYRFFVYYHFPLTVFLCCRFLLKNMNYQVTKTHKKALWSFLFGRNGLIADRKHHYWAFNKKGFHPWQFDDANLVETWQRKLAPRIISP